MMIRRLLSVVAALALLGGVSACSNMSASESAEPVEWIDEFDPSRPTQNVSYEADPHVVTVSQIVPPKAGESEGSAVVYIPPLSTEAGHRFTISSVSNGKSGGTSVVELCGFDFSQAMATDGNCSGLQYSGGSGGEYKGSHVRVDGLHRGSHTLQIRYSDSSDLKFHDTRYINFEIPPLHR